MNIRLSILFISSILLVEAWQTPEHRRYVGNLRGDSHFHTKRHMLPRDSEPKRRFTSQRPKEFRKKPSGHLTPLNEDDIENDEVISVAVGPPAMRPKFEKLLQQSGKTYINVPSSEKVKENKAGTNIVKDVLIQLGREFLSHPVSEDFVFGQYVGNAMKNLTTELKLRMQHDILELIVKYQKLKTGEVAQATTMQPEEKLTSTIYNEIKEIRYFRDRERKNDTDDGWPDFNNLAKIVGK